MSGWIKTHRTIQQHYLWQDKPFAKGQAWIDILLLANHKDNKFMLGNELLDVERGSFITSEIKLMERWGWSKSKVRNFLSMLEKDSMLVKKTDTKKTTLTVLNYDVWQDSETTKEPQKDHERTTKEPQKDTNKNVKNVKNEKKSIYGEYKNVKLTDTEYQSLLDDYGIDNLNNLIKKVDEGVEAKGYKYKNFKITIKNWADRDNLKKNSDKVKAEPQKLNFIDFDSTEEMAKYFEPKK